MGKEQMDKQAERARLDALTAGVETIFLNPETLRQTRDRLAKIGPDGAACVVTKLEHQCTAQLNSLSHLEAALKRSNETSILAIKMLDERDAEISALEAEVDRQRRLVQEADKKLIVKSIEKPKKGKEKKS